MFNVEDQGPIAGLAEVVSAEPGAEPTAARMDEAATAIASAGIPLLSTMGSLDDLKGLVRRVWFRKLVRELPEQTFSLPWFECHVPPGGTTSVLSKVTTQSGGAIGLKLFGSGLGRGRSVKLTVSHASEARKACATFSLDVRVKPRIYDSFGQESAELETVAVLGQKIETIAQCPYCGVAPETVDKFDFVFGQYVDLRGDQVLGKRTFNIEAEDSLSWQAGVRVPEIPVELALGASVSKKVVLDVEHGLPPRYLYKPYHRASRTPLQTEMWAVDGDPP